ncbi:hypothetical protein IFM46972_07644 [Aspergillus udagawae]|uniref:Uncharacterized protein n=1 Tax=Aspergillus udagawae TaxID=91492 RepID=A0A8H3S0K3_9EURO|nr:hypothetical protein IFM46972_07644 [Aspergillus udagawae]
MHHFLNGTARHGGYRVFPSCVLFLRKQGMYKQEMLFETQGDDNQTESARSEWTNAFDLVHQRLFLVLFSDEEVARILQGLISCVKPGGGWIQLFEGSGQRLHDPRAKYFGTFYDLAERKLQHIEVGARLGDSLRKAGLVNIHHETADFNIGCSNPDKELGEKGARNILSIFDMWQNETSREEIGLSQEEWENLGRLAPEDMRTYRTEMRYHIDWAQKPVDGF